MSKITYLLGAGASFHPFPLVKATENIEKVKGLPSLQNSISNLVELLQHYSDTDLGIESDDVHKIILLLLDLGESSKDYHNLDTYAKYLYHSYPKKFTSLKKALSIYFTLVEYSVRDYLERNRNRKQSFSKNQHNGYVINPRYKNLLISLFDSQNNFPSDVNFISWNYDSQLELAAKMISPIPDPIISFPRDYNRKSEGETKYNVFHINGQSGIYLSGNDVETLYEKSNTQTASITEVFKHCAEILYRSRDFIEFSFERKPHLTGDQEQKIEMIRNMISGTEILIVIGYSFPFFNRDIDGKILTHILKPTLKMIYIQNPLDIGDGLFSQFNLKKAQESVPFNKLGQTTVFAGKKQYTGIKINWIKSTDEFHLPFEI